MVDDLDKQNLEQLASQWSNTEDWNMKYQTDVMALNYISDCRYKREETTELYQHYYSRKVKE